MLRSTIICSKMHHLPILLLTIAAATWIARPEQARAARSQPSAFAGCYSGGVPDSLSVTDAQVFISIADSGRISGSTWWGGAISGRIWNDGYLELNWPVFSFEVGKGRRRVRSLEVIGVAALDADGNLFGLLEWPWGDTTQFFWQRCH